MIRTDGIRLLLDMERMRDGRRTDAHRLIGPVLAVANLLLLAYAERFLRDDAAILPSLLALDVLLLLSLSALYILGSATPALDRTALFPLRAGERHLYILAGTLRWTPALLWTGGLVLAFVILFHHSAIEWIGTSLLLILLIVTTTSWLAAFTLIMRRARIAPHWLFVAPAIAIPAAVQVAAGISGLASGDPAEGGKAGLLLLGFFILSFPAARRWG